MSTVVRVELPSSLCLLAGAPHVVSVPVAGAVTQRAVLDGLEQAFPKLRGTIRDQVSQVRRPFIRFFACEQDLSHLPPDEELPQAVRDGAEAFLIIGAIAGGSQSIAGTTSELPKPQRKSSKGHLHSGERPYILILVRHWT